MRKHARTVKSSSHFCMQGFSQLGLGDFLQGCPGELRHQADLPGNLEVGKCAPAHFEHRRGDSPVRCSGFTRADECKSKVWRVGKVCVSTCYSQGWTYHTKKNK